MGILPICILPELEPYDNRDLSAESSEILLYPSCDIVSLNISGGSVIMWMTTAWWWLAWTSSVWSPCVYTERGGLSCLLLITECVHSWRFDDNRVPCKINRPYSPICHCVIYLLSYTRPLDLYPGADPSQFSRGGPDCIRYKPCWCKNIEYIIFECSGESWLVDS